MTKFNPENKEVLTYGECLKPAMEITNKEDAIQYKKEYIEYTQRHLDKDPRDDNMTAEEIVNCNIGYFSGYYDSKVAERVKKLFNCSHPIFDKN